jgi:DNA-directed RNA polymerase specialized sigma24 family protein
LDRSAREALQRGMCALADGDRSAFDAVFAALWPVLLRFAKRALPDDTEGAAEDAAQSALVKVFSHAAEFDPSRDALSWVLGIAAYECRTVRKSRARRREDLSAAPPEPEPVAASPEDIAIDADLQAAAAGIVGSLRPVDATTLLAAAHGHRQGTSLFRKRLERALSRFRKEWRARHGED